MSPMRDLNEDRELRTNALLLGHIRLGTFDGRHPVQSDTFIFTSADAPRLKPLAEDFGGTIERYEPQGAGTEPWRLISGADAFTALFPFPDRETNVAQSWELWGRAGIQRTCDGYDATLIEVDEISGEVTESPRPCICAAQDTRECAPTTRLRFLLPQTGLGIWELVTNSRVVATQLSDQASFIDSVAGGRMNRLPIRAVYAPRQISYFDVKEQRRRTTTKRIVSLSIAGDASRALAALGVEQDKALIEAVRGVLADTGRALELPGARGREDPALPAGSSVGTATSPAPPAPSRQDAAPGAEHGTTEAEDAATHQGADPDGAAATQARSGGTPSSAPAGDAEPASAEQWARAIKAGVSKSVALKRVRAKFKLELRSASEITTGQLAAILEEALAS